MTGRLQKLYEARQAELGMTDAEIMRKAGLPPNWWRQYCNDREARGPGFPRADTLRSLAKGLGVPYLQLVQAVASDWYGIDMVQEDERYLQVAGMLGDTPAEVVEEIIEQMKDSLRREDS